MKEDCCINVEYFKNVISISNATSDDSSVINDIYKNVRESYFKWSSDVRLQKFDNDKTIVGSFQWKGMSTWWLNPLTMKDSNQNNSWLNIILITHIYNEFRENIVVRTDSKILLKTIRKNFNGKNINKYNKFEKESLKEILMFKFPSTYHLLLFIKSLLRIAEIKIVLLGRRKVQQQLIKKVKSNIVWFETYYPASWIDSSSDGFVDRHLYKAVSLGNSYGIRVGYLAYLLRFEKDSHIGPIKLWSNIRELSAKVKCDVIFVEAHLRFYDLIEAYLSTLVEFCKFWIIKHNNSFRRLFFINSLDFSDVLLNEWQNNYFSMFVYYKLHGLAVVRFLEDAGSPQTIVSYTEFMNLIRFSYFGAKKLSSDNKFIAYQHAMNEKNKMWTYFHENEINIDNYTKDLSYMPVPDYFLVQGDHYRKILSSFYDDKRIHIVGSLKYDYLASMGNDIDKIRSELIDKYSLKNKITILLAPSVSDFIDILNIISELHLDDKFKFLISKHPATSLEILKETHNKVCADIDIYFDCSETTIELATIASLVICGYSTVAIEVAYLGVRSVRAIPLGLFPSYDSEELIPEFHSSDQFCKWFEKQNWNNEMKDVEKAELHLLAERYFYKLDGNTADRLWNFINNQTSFSDRSGAVVVNDKCSPMKAKDVQANLQGFGADAIIQPSQGAE
jgi:hypothetical protein